MTELTNPAYNINQENPTGSASQLPSAKPPEQDFYRTPTIEDYSLHVRQNKQGCHHGERSSRSHHIEFPLSALLGAQALNLSDVAPQTPVSDTLGWRDRIRHFTWTFFSLTMATGGIANVLFTGNKHMNRFLWDQTC